MRLKIPVVKRCCFCWPMRRGLIAWGCFKMIADGILITFLTISLTRDEMSLINVLDSQHNIISMIFGKLISPVTALAVFIVDFFGTILFLFGRREKNILLTQIFYFISIAMWIITLIDTTVKAVIILQQSNLKRLFAAFSFFFLIVAVQTYFLIVLRSQIIKLRNNDKLPQDKAAEAECTNQYDDIVVEEEIGKEDV